MWLVDVQTSHEGQICTKILHLPHDHSVHGSGTSSPQGLSVTYKKVCMCRLHEHTDSYAYIYMQTMIPFLCLWLHNYNYAHEQEVGCPPQHFFVGLTSSVMKSSMDSP